MQQACAVHFYVPDHCNSLVERMLSSPSPTIHVSAEINNTFTLNSLNSAPCDILVAHINSLPSRQNKDDIKGIEEHFARAVQQLKPQPASLILLYDEPYPAPAFSLLEESLSAVPVIRLSTSLNNSSMEASLGSQISNACQLKKLQAELEINQKISHDMMVANSQMGEIVHFHQRSYRCLDYDALSNTLQRVLTHFTLSGAILITVDKQDLYYEFQYEESVNDDMFLFDAEDSEVNETESDDKQAEDSSAKSNDRDLLPLIQQHRNAGRIFDFAEGTIVNFDSISILATNMPAKDSDYYGQLKDILATLGESSDFCINSISKEIASHKAERSKISFLSTMSHELLTPMNSILGFSNLLAKKKEGDIFEGREVRGLIAVQSNAQRLMQLIEDLLALSDIDDTHVHRENIILRDVLFETIEKAKVDARKKGLILKSNLLDSDIIIKSDMRRIRLIIRSILFNAVKFK